MFSRITLPSAADKGTLETELIDAEKQFVIGLKEQAFDAIRSQSRAAIEDMVEFMPKPELAKMAEALVNLTSIKRRVSRGMETVGGPIDVAIISQSEGFVWVKRKHYFPPELNSRYFERVRAEVLSNGESRHAEDAKFRGNGRTRAKQEVRKSRSRKSPTQSPERSEGD